MVKKYKTPIIVLGAVVLGFLLSKIYTTGSDTRVLDSSANSEAVVLMEREKGNKAPIEESEVEERKTEDGEASSPEQLSEISPEEKGNVAVLVEGGGAGVAKPSGDSALGEIEDEGEGSKKEEPQDISSDRSARTKSDDRGEKAHIKKDSEAIRTDQYGFEIANLGNEDIFELEGRLVALEQAFSIDGRRNKGRSVSGWDEGEELNRINESLTNLYEIVESLPSIDTLQAKMTAVDTAIEEMNETIEAINAVAQKIQNSEIDVAVKASGEAVQAANEALVEVKRISETVEGLADGEKFKDLLTKHDETAENLTKSSESLVSKTEEIEENLRLIKEEIDGVKAKQDSAIKNIALLDKNIHVLSSSYRMVYENALRVDERLSKLEEERERVNKRVLLLENNLLPPD
jgi:chromosome segregation ATPase